MEEEEDVVEDVQEEPPQLNVAAVDKVEVCRRVILPDSTADEECRSRLVALSLSLLMAAILQAIRSLGSLLHDVIFTVHWNVDSQ